MLLRPLFSLCHTTARLPDGWRYAAAAWRGFCDHPERVEHVLSADSSLPAFRAFFDRTRVVVNEGERSAVAGWNAAARAARGRVLISVADDWYPPEHWDTKLAEVLAGRLDTPAVVEVDTGGNPGLLTFSILTRAYYDRLQKEYGYDGLFFPEYLGMYADNDFDMFARRDKVVVDARRLFFFHRHPEYGHGEMDAVHQWQHRPEAFERGAKIYRRRRREFGFPAQIKSPDQVRVLALCLPGETFSKSWMASYSALLFHLFQRFVVVPFFSYSTNVYITRASIADAVGRFSPRPDLLLWLDDDNALTPAQFELLRSTLDTRLDLEAVGGWCWAEVDDSTPRSTARLSCGSFDARGACVPWHEADLLRGEDDVRRVEYSGFPAMLMRIEALERADNPFCPVVSPALSWGFAGEDVSFCKNVPDLRLAIHRKVQVVHWKTQPLEPADVPAAAAAVEVA